MMITFQDQKDDEFYDVFIKYFETLKRLKIQLDRIINSYEANTQL